MVNPAVLLPNGEHIFALRVYYEDTDAGGVVYYANYLRFAERARTEMIRGLGVVHGELARRDGAAFAVRHCAADYLRPARLDDRLTVHTRVVAVGGASLQAYQVVRREEDELVRLDVRLAYMTYDGRPRRLPREVRTNFEEICDMRGIV
ncbi:MAG: tol-pal system-associated acyl-CoA thioesterase [Rhodospirillales bacterium]|jgi:acyl-CoA thioester hydrolase